jgi:hypothetical protein
VYPQLTEVWYPLPPDQAVLESWLSAVGESVLAMFPRWACPFTARPNICIEVQ